MFDYAQYRQKQQERAKERLDKAFAAYWQFLDKHYAISEYNGVQWLGGGTCLQQWLNMPTVLCFATEEYGEIYYRRGRNLVKGGYKTARRLENRLQAARDNARICGLTIY